MGFTLQGVGPFLHWLTLGILFMLPLLLAYAVYKLGGLPGSIARSRGHPQADAISVCGWMGIVTIVMWPIAMVWAHLRPSNASASSTMSESDISSFVEKLQVASKRLAALETSLSTKRRT